MIVLAGNRLVTTYGGANRVLTTTYDALNRLKTLTEDGRTTTYRYDLNGNIVEKELPDGDTVTMAYDGLNRIEQMSAVSGGGIDPEDRWSGAGACALGER